MGSGHPECPQRLDAIQDRLLISGVSLGLTPMQAAPAALSDIELAHDRMHVAALRGMSDRLREELTAGGPEHAAIDPDTLINAHTWSAALRSVGAAVAATAECRETHDCCTRAGSSSAAGSGPRPNAA